MSGSGYSNVGGSQVYEAGDQRNVKRSDLEEAAKHSIGSTDAHHPKDARKHSPPHVRPYLVVIQSCFLLNTY